MYRELHSKLVWATVIVIKLGRMGYVRFIFRMAEIRNTNQLSSENIKENSLEGVGIDGR
jgi:hypothetical protein